MSVRAPVLFLPHGGGPLPVLGDPGHESLSVFLSSVSQQFGSPDAIVVISAHWETDGAAVTAAPQPELFFDYYNFPRESYELTYRAPGNPSLASTIGHLLQAAGIHCEQDIARGFDHGMFIPLLLMYPDAQLPCVQLSLRQDLDADYHIRLGQALTPLRGQNVLIIGSGMSYHNMAEFFNPQPEGREHNEVFDRWLLETCAGAGLDEQQRLDRLRDWDQVPSARECHTREEHLLPLHVCMGAATGHTGDVEVVFNGDVLGRRVSSFLWT